MNTNFTDSLMALWSRVVAGGKGLRVRHTIRVVARRDPQCLRVLFVCGGNSCRSQMAEAFANTYGQGLLAAKSAGVRPAPGISRRTHLVMEERGISLHRHYPKHLYAFSLSSFDLIVNLSRRQLPRTPVPILRFPVPNPVGQPEDFHREVRNIVEHLVEMVLLEVSGRRDILSLATRTGNLGRCFGTPAPIRLPDNTRRTQRAASVRFQ